MRRAEELLGEGGGDGGHRAVAGADEHHHHHEHHGGGAEHERGDEARGDVEHRVGQQRDAEAAAVVEHAEDDAAQAVHYRDEADGERGHALGGAALDKDVARVGDEAGAEARADDGGAEEQPEALCAQHLPGRQPAGGGGGVGVAVDPRRQDEGQADERGCQQQRAGEDIGEVPAEAGGGDEPGGEAAEHQRARAEAHEQHAGGEALLVREPGHDGGDDAVIHKADAYAGDGEGDEQQPDEVRLQEHAEHEADAAEYASDGYGDADAAAVGHRAAEDAAEAEARQHHREAGAELGVGPAEAGSEGHGVDAPGVDDAVYEQHRRARDERSGA